MDGPTESDEELLAATDKSVPLHSMDGIKSKAKVVGVYDGDSITIVMKYNNKLDKFKIRMTGYDAPEMRPAKTSKNKEAEVEQAKAAKELLKEKILDKIVMLHCHEFDKYGRLLGTVYLKEDESSKAAKKIEGESVPIKTPDDLFTLNVNQWMIENAKGCYAYEGGTKKIFEE